MNQTTAERIMPPRWRRMQGRKCNLPGNNKNKQFIKNIHWTKCQSAQKKTYINYNTTVKSKPNEKNTPVQKSN